MFTIGVEEEFLLVDPKTGQLSTGSCEVVSAAQATLDESELEPELQQSQVETGTPVCRSLQELRRELSRLREEAAAAAREHGSVIAASGSHPFAGWRSSAITPEDGYLRLERDYQQLAREQIVCGCHVHVGIEDAEDAIQVMNRVRPWLPPILALSANSPFWLGEDTGYASYRNRIWQRWPIAGTPAEFSSRSEYEAAVAALIRTGSLDRPARLYWDVRPSAKFSTLEFRVADVCLSIDEALLVAALTRALTQTCYEELRLGRPGIAVRYELLSAAMWRAARYGTGKDLIDVQSRRAVPAGEMMHKLFGFVRPALAGNGEEAEVADLLRLAVSRGTGASRQRAAYAAAGRMEAVVEYIVAETARG